MIFFQCGQKISILSLLMKTMHQNDQKFGERYNQLRFLLFLTSSFNIVLMELIYLVWVWYWLTFSDEFSWKYFREWITCIRTISFMYYITCFSALYIFFVSNTNLIVYCLLKCILQLYSVHYIKSNIYND